MYQLVPEQTLAALLDFSGRLAAALSVDSVATVVVEDGRGAVGATHAAVALFDAPNGHLALVAVDGARGAAGLPDGLVSAAAAGSAVYGTGRAGAWAALPLTAGEQVIGAARFEFDRYADLPPRDRALVVLVSRQAADALQRARLFAAERAAREEAEAANQIKDEFLATLSHELRTPLNSILGWAHLLRHGALDQVTTTRALDAILRNAQAQSRLVADVLDASRLITGRLCLHVGPVNLRAVVRAALEAIAPAAAARGVQLEFAAAGGEVEVTGDADRLQQVTWNLVSNAVKFTPAGGRVEIQLECVPDGVELVVADTGTGIASEFIPRVFDHFTQADASTRRAHGGLGLGLAIVRHLVELHGGTVAAFSPGAGLGSRFTVRLPAGQSSEA
jgi:signal transduction histidine kinase